MVNMFHTLKQQEILQFQLWGKAKRLTIVNEVRESDAFRFLLVKSQLNENYNKYSSKESFSLYVKNGGLVFCRSHFLFKFLQVVEIKPLSHCLVEIMEISHKYQTTYTGSIFNHVIHPQPLSEYLSQWETLKAICCLLMLLKKMQCFFIIIR
jgi:hypothetical protein